MHDVYFNIPHFQLYFGVQWHVTGGVIWRATFESTTKGGSDSGGIQVRSREPWLASSTMGALDRDGTKNLYIEDSMFINVGMAPDVEEGARVVVRHSRYIGAWGTVHGTPGTLKGRQLELYDNDFSYPDSTRNLNWYFWVRAGSAVITRNTVQKIQGQMWGSKSSFLFAVEDARKGNPCCTSYMCFHQPGSGANGASQISDPVYIWANSGTGSGATDMAGLSEGSPATCGTGFSTRDFFKPNRDYFVNSGAKPGYASYSYPHPLRDALSETGLPPPTNLRTM
jgi:hypothetical protein